MHIPTFRLRSIVNVMFKVSKSIYITMIGFLFWFIIYGCSQNQTSGDESGHIVDNKVKLIQHVIDTANMVHINCFDDENGTPMFRGGGVGFKEGMELPIIIYSTNSDGALSGLGVLVGCPFVKLNPAILDYSKTEGDGLIVGYQYPDEAGIDANFRIKFTGNHLVFIDSSYVVFPITEDKTNYLEQTDGPFLTLLFQTPDEQIFLWDKATVTIDGEEPGIVSSKITDKGELVISKLPRKKIHISVQSEKTGKKSEFDLFPIFRGATPSTVTCLLPDIPIEN